MRIYILAVCFCAVLISCDNKPGGKDVIAPEKMQLILTDMHYAETYSTMVNDSFMRNKNKDSLASFYKSILSHHKISMDEFRSSIDWYKMNPEQLDSVYANMIPNLSKQESIYPVK